MGLIQTKCPYCGATDSFWWQEKVISHIGDTPAFARPINVAEVYCNQCNHTLSLIPLTVKD